jgi:hypothetical protein
MDKGKWLTSILLEYLYNRGLCHRQNRQHKP